MAASAHDEAVTTTSDAAGLLRPVAPGGHFHQVAILGWNEDDATLAMGYLEAADVLVNHWKLNRPNDLLALPILNTYRHGIELALKAVIHVAARCLRADGHRDAELQPAALAEQLSGTHSIGELADQLARYLLRLDVTEGERVPDSIMDVLKALHAADSNGQWFRYSTVRTWTGKGKARKLVLEPARPDQIKFDLEAVAQQLQEAGSLIIHGGFGVLEQYEEWQGYLRQEAEGW